MTRRFGATPEAEGVRFRLWAPSLRAVALERQGHPPEPMRAAGDGFFEHVAGGARAGDVYRFVSGDFMFADPASRGQVADADGWSRVVAPFVGVRPSKTIRPWREAIVAEVHVGTATPEGTFLGLVPRLGRFREAGYTAIELMPVGDFMGRRNWGYDGVLPFAPDTAYGSPEDLATLVAAAHELGLGMLLDVVYNHFGPSGLALNRVAEPFFTDRLPTPWGPAIDLDNPVVRAFFVENACQWIGDYGFDGLRLDAVHAFVTEGGDRLLDEIATAVRALKPDAWLVLENDLNAARWLERGEDGLPRRYTAQWNDDVHHILHVAATGEKAGYYEDFADEIPVRMARAFAEGFVYQGEASRHRGGTPRGERSAHLPPDAFVAFVQNHDQIGNRPFGDRIASRIGGDRLAFLTFVGMLAPQVPLFFMGEESGLTVPFPFFVDFGPPLDEAVRQGRKAEFLHFFGAFGLEAQGEPPDPNAEATFRSAVLTDAHFDEPGARLERERFAGWARLRARIVWPLAASGYRGAETTIGRDAFAVTWRFTAGGYAMALNFGERPARFPAPPVLSAATVGTVAEEDGTVTLAPWSAAVWADLP